MDTPQELIDNGKTIKEFVESPVIDAAFKSVERSYVNEFANADDDEKRRQVWAKSRALVDFRAELTRRVVAGNNAKVLREREEALAERNKRVNRAK